MKQRLFSLLALILSLCLLCGCSDFSMEAIGSFLTGSKTETVVTPETEEEAEQQEAEQQEMASQAVLNTAEAPDTLMLAYQEEYGLNPFTTKSLNNRTILSLLYEPLFLVNDRFETEPVLAADIQTSEDGITTTITLQRNVSFHSGQPMTAEDVVYSFSVAKNSDYYGNRFFQIYEVTAQDSRTVVITAETAMENVALLLDFPIVRSGTGTDAVPDGTGPFVYSDTYKLARFTGWWQEVWYLDYDSAQLTPCTTSADIRDHFEYGEVNLVCTDPSSQAYAAFHNDFELWSSPTTVMQYIGFNQNMDLFSNAAVRACITYAIDRETIVAEDFGGFALEATLPASPLSPCYDEGLAAEYDLDLDDFHQLLEDAQIRDYTGDGILDVYYKGYAIPLAAELMVNAASSQRVDTAHRIADNLNALGFDITVSAVDEATFTRALQYQTFDLYYGEIRLSSNFDLGPFFRSGGSASYGDLANGTCLNLCSAMLENSGNAYDLHKRIMDKGLLCPVLFKSYAVYTARGAAADLSPAIDWVIH